MAQSGHPLLATPVLHRVVDQSTHSKLASLGQLPLQRRQLPIAVYFWLQATNMPLPRTTLLLGLLLLCVGPAGSKRPKGRSRQKPRDSTFAPKRCFFPLHSPQPSGLFCREKTAPRGRSTSPTAPQKAPPDLRGARITGRRPGLHDRPPRVSPRPNLWRAVHRSHSNGWNPAAAAAAHAAAAVSRLTPSGTSRNMLKPAMHEGRS